MVEVEFGVKEEHSPDSLAALLGLRQQGVDFIGPNPFEDGATEDGFVLFSEGNAWDRKLNVKYLKEQVLERIQKLPVVPKMPQIFLARSRQRTQRGPYGTRMLMNMAACFLRLEELKFQTEKRFSSAPQIPSGDGIIRLVG